MIFAGGVDGSDPNLTINPSVSAAPSQLPLHKGAIGFCFLDSIDEIFTNSQSEKL